MSASAGNRAGPSGRTCESRRSRTRHPSLAPRLKRCRFGVRSCINASGSSASLSSEKCTSTHSPRKHGQTVATHCGHKHHRALAGSIRNRAEQRVGPRTSPSGCSTQRRGDGAYPVMRSHAADIHDGSEHELQSEAGYIDARPQTADRLNSLATHGHFGHLLGASGQPPTPEYGAPHRPRRMCQVRTLSPTLGYVSPRSSSDARPVHQSKIMCGRKPRSGLDRGEAYQGPPALDGAALGLASSFVSDWTT
jgi:hypothetical protein